MAWEYNMLLCDGRGCSCSVSITFRNRKNKMYHEEDYFCETSIQLCNSKCCKSTSDLWHVCIYQTSFEALPVAGCAVLHPVSHLLVLKVFCSWFPPGSLVWQCPLKLVYRVALWHPALEGQWHFFHSWEDECGACGKAQASPEGVCVSGGLICPWACFLVLGGWTI